MLLSWSRFFLLVFFAQCTSHRASGQLYPYNRYIFERKVQEALRDVRDTLDKERNVQIAEDQDHTYADKFALVEQQTHALWRNLESVLARLGLENLDASHGLNLYFEGNRSCDFEKEAEMEEVGDGEEIIEMDGSGGEKVKTSRSIRKVKTFHWNVTAAYQVYACAGDCEAGRKIDLKQRKMSTTVVSKAKQVPIRDLGNVFEKVNLTWWAKHNAKDAYSFSIDRDEKSCKTPRRNRDVEKVLEFTSQLHEWCLHSMRFLVHIYTPAEEKGVPDFRRISAFTLLSLVPLMENSTVLSTETLEHFLTLDLAALDKNMRGFKETYPSPDHGSMISSDEFSLNELLDYMRASIVHHYENMGYVEDMLRKQLFSAIGRHLTPEDFDEYMQFHSRKIFSEVYAPRHFSHAIRRPNQYPVGIASIENDRKEPVQTFSRRIAGEGKHSVLIPIDAATSVEMTGDRVLSGWIRYQFGWQSAGGSSKLLARARQFSSFMLLIGTMTGPNCFDPKNAIILQNKDEVLIPLLTEVLPSAKDFKDAIASLSPEQQEFAKAFRSMQLESSVFAVCLIQLKPQLERLLNLPDSSLAKEIKLTEDLMSLFIDYQIPSDLLSYDGAADYNATDKVATVRKYADQVLQVIKATKKEQLKEERGKDEMFRATQHVPPSESPSASPSSVPTPRTATARKLGSAEGGNLRAASIQMDAPPGMMMGADSANFMASDTPTTTQNKKHYEDTTSDTATSDQQEEDDDFTSIPARLDALLEEHDTDSYLRSTILKAHDNDSWTRQRQPNLLSDLEIEYLRPDTTATEKKKAFDLLDALSRSGTLPIASAELHVVIATTHCFEHSLIETVIEDNINPIVKAEKSALMVASTIYDNRSSSSSSNLRDLLTVEAAERLAMAFPELFGENEEGGKSKG